MSKRSVVLFIATSLDGYIAGPDGDLTFLSMVERPGEDYGYAQFYAGVGTVILGRRTYDKVLSFGVPFPHRDKESYVISRSRTGEENGTKFYSGDLSSLIGNLRNRDEGDIFVDGGAEIVRVLMQKGLIDQIVLSIVPIMLGDGIRLFDDTIPVISLVLDEYRSFESGLLQLWYSVKS